MRQANPPAPSRLRAARNLAVLAGLAAALGAVAGADKLPPEPVEAFNRALQTEKSDSLDARLDGKARKLAIDFRKKNLNRAANNLRSLSDVAQALLLPNWPIEDTSEYDQEARDVDNDVRQALLDRFVKGLRNDLARGSPSRQAAVAILLGETAIASSADLDRGLADPRDRGKRMAEAGRENLFRELSKLAPDLAKLASSPSPLVRGAAARALGQFPRRPYTVTRALDRILATDRDHVANRREAANSLLSLIQTVTGTEPNVASEPGILSRETRRNKRLFTARDRVAVWAAVIPVATRGLSDRDVRVRRASATAIQQAAGALSQEIFLTSRDPLFKSFPPKERKDLAPAERRRILEGYKEIEKFEELIKPAIAALTASRVNSRTVPQLLVEAACDPDLEVRLGVRRTFDEMARARRFLKELRALLPPIDLKEKPEPEPLDPPKKKKDIGKEKNDLSRAASPSRVVLVSDVAPPLLTLPPVQSVQAQDGPKGEKPDLPQVKDDKDDKDDLPKKKDRDEDADPFEKVKVDRDALGKALLGIGEELIRRGVNDPNPAGRRATAEAIEALADTGAVFVAPLVRALKDPDRFVRWIAARALGKMAPASAGEVVPALMCLLDEQDLDVRVAVIDALGLYNSSAVRAVPELAKRVNKGDSESRLAIMRALEYIGKQAAPALPAVRPLLTAQDPRLRAEAARLMGRFGRLASDYLPDLRRLLNDPDSEVRRAASAAIILITDR